MPLSLQVNLTIHVEIKSQSPSLHHWFVWNTSLQTNKNLKIVLTSGKAYTSLDVDYTVKVEAKGLTPFTRYYYQFTVRSSSVHSPVEQTKTIPKAGNATANIKLAIYSCSNFPFEFFNAYGNPVRKDSVDYVIHLGDCIYEYKNGDYG